MKNRVFTTGEAAKICGVSPDTVARWVDAGHLQGYRPSPDGDRRIPCDHLKHFMEVRGIPLERIEP